MVGGLCGSLLVDGSWLLYWNGYVVSRQTNRWLRGIYPVPVLVDNG